MSETLSNSLCVAGNVGECLRGGPEDDVVISSRVRLARNIAEYPFLLKASAQEIARIEELLRSKIVSSAVGDSLTYYRLDKLDAVLRQLLVERQLIGKDHAEAHWVRGVAFSPEERLSVMVNEEDHLRMQAMRGGLQLREAFEDISRVDDALGELIPFAFSARYGYLTACPTNVGTGMRASVMVHLPALVMAHEMDKVAGLCERMALALRGRYGEGTHGSADLYQVSNGVTLGVKEEDVLQELSHAADHIMTLERSCRQSFYSGHQSELRNRIQRARELLADAAMISSEEALHLLSQVRMGVQLGLVRNVPLEALNELLLLTLPAHLQTIEGRKLDRLGRSKARADYLRKRLALN